jgi:hypothetical protein
MSSTVLEGSGISTGLHVYRSSMGVQKYRSKTGV